MSGTTGPIVRRVSFLGWLALTAACATGGPISRPTVGDDSISLAKAEPAPGTPLHDGDVVTFRVIAKYRLSPAAAGHATLVFQDDASQLLYPDEHQTTVEVNGSDGIIELSQTVTVPDGIRAIHLHVPLFSAGSSKSADVVRVTYPILPGRLTTARVRDVSRLEALLPETTDLPDTCKLEKIDPTYQPAHSSANPYFSTDKSFLEWLAAGSRGFMSSSGPFDAADLTAAGLAVYFEGDEIGVHLLAFATEERAVSGETALGSYESLLRNYEKETALRNKDRHHPSSAMREPNSAVFRHGRYVVRIWRDPSTTGQCFQKLGAHFEKVVK